MLDTSAVANAKAKKSAEQIRVMQKAILSLAERIVRLENEVAALKGGEPIQLPEEKIEGLDISPGSIEEEDEDGDKDENI